MQNKKTPLLNRSALTAAITAVTLSGQALALDFHGYMRAGIGNNIAGGGQVCYGNGGPNGHMVGRLGDECDMYAEINMSEEVFAKDGVSFKVHSNVAYGTEETGDVPQMNSQGNSWQAQGGDSTSPWEGGRLSVREMYVSAKGLLSDSTVWAGKRFGQRKDIHILDFFYLMNSGYGIGFDNLSAGAGKFSFNWTQAHTGGGTDAFADYDWGVGGADQDVVNGSTKGWQRLNKLEGRYSFGVGEGNLDLVGIYGKPSLSDAQEKAGDFDEDSFLLMAEYSMGIMGGFNKFVLSYGTNVFQNFRDGFWGLNNATWLGEGDGFGIIDHGVIKLGQQLDLGYAVMYSSTNPDKDKGNGWFEADALSLVVRPQYKWNDTMSTLLEVGYDNIDYDSDAHQGRIGGEDLYKVTVAQAWSPLANGGFWARPQLRLFVSHYGGDRAVDDAEMMVGGQVEAWW